MPGTPSRTIAQSWPGVAAAPRLPAVVDLAGVAEIVDGVDDRVRHDQALPRREELVVAATTLPARSREARSGYSVKSGMSYFLESALVESGWLEAGWLERAGWNRAGRKPAVRNRAVRNRADGIGLAADQELAARLAGFDEGTAEIGGADDPVEGPPLVGRDRIAVLQPRGVDRERLVRREDGEVRGRPTAIEPLPVSRTRRRCAAIQSTTCGRSCPRRRASVQISGKPSCSDEMPPHAAAKSPSPSDLSSGCARRMVGDDHVDDAVGQTPARADRRWLTRGSAGST